MSVTQDYKILKLTRAQVAELKIALAASIENSMRRQREAVTVDLADAYASAEREQRELYAVLGQA